MKKNENSYKKSGVNIALANKLVNHISNISKKRCQKNEGYISKRYNWWIWIFIRYKQS